MGELIETSVPFRWDLVTPDQLGSMLAGTTKPDLWFVDDLVQCTGKALARSANGGPHMVERGRVVAITEGPRLVAYFHVDQTA